jgi:uncharacterized MAPEG superfamily protein
MNCIKNLMSDSLHDLYKVEIIAVCLVLFFLFSATQQNDIIKENDCRRQVDKSKAAAAVAASTTQHCNELFSCFLHCILLFGFEKRIFYRHQFFVLLATRYCFTI